MIIMEEKDMCKKNSIKDCFRTIVTVVICTLALAGCSSEEIPEKVNLVIVGGPRACMNQISSDMTTVNELLYEASSTYGNVTFINCDGKPHVYASVDIPEPSVHGMDDAALRKRATDYTDQLKQLFSQGAAQYPETDLLSALQLASKAFADADEDSRCVLMILDSGLSTVKIDFRQQIYTGEGNKPQYMLTAIPESIVSELEKECELPKLNNAKVYFAFCGDTAYPQEPLTEKQKGQLKDIWQNILISGGASEVNFTNDFAMDIPYEGMPVVSTVPVDVMSISPETDVIETMVLDEKGVEFIGDTADYIDPEAAESVLRGVADLLIANPENNVYLVGTTATGRYEYTQELSQRRAEAVKATLTDFGVPEDRMIPVGLGCSNYWHIDDTDENGHHIEELASKNRAVRIVDINSDDAEHVLESM